MGESRIRGGRKGGELRKYITKTKCNCPHVCNILELSVLLLMAIFRRFIQGSVCGLFPSILTGEPRRDCPAASYVTTSSCYSICFSCFSFPFLPYETAISCGTFVLTSLWCKQLSVQFLAHFVVSWLLSKKPVRCVSECVHSYFHWQGGVMEVFCTQHFMVTVSLFQPFVSLFLLF